MYSRRHAVAIVLSTVLSSTAAMAAPAIRSGTPVPQAPIGHLQPRAQQFSPRSSAEQIEQERMSSFDAEQQKLDQQLDKKLNICRC